MILRITNKCKMNCSHCFINTCSDDSKHMDYDTLNSVCEYLYELKPKVLLISGGEPTEHPYFIQILDRLMELLKNDTKIILLSNGMFLENENLTSEILSRDILIQITNDKRYYPKRLKQTIPFSEKIEFIEKIQKLYPLGNVIKNMPDKVDKFKGASCFNVRSLAKNNVNNLKELVNVMENQVFKFCYLSIDYDGTIRGGESDECLSLGNVRDGSSIIFNNLKNRTINDCDKCGLLSSMGEAYKKAID